MKNIIICVLFLVANLSLYSQTPSYEWVKKIGGISSERVYAMTTDGNDVYVGGYFDSSILNFNSSSMNNSGSSDAFIIKYDLNGNVLWSKKIGGIGVEFINSIKTDSFGNVYVYGKFSNTLTVDSTSLVSLGGADLFLIKYDSSGNLIWSKSFGTLNYDDSCKMTMTNQNKILITGIFSSGNLSLGSINLSTSAFTSYIAQLDLDGNFIWANLIPARTYALDSDNLGNAIVGAFFNNSTISFGTINFTNSGGDDFYIAKYNSNGVLLWVNKYGGSSNDRLSALTVDSSGQIYIVGNFESSNVSFGTVNLTVTPFFVSNFLAKLNADGTTVWARKMNSSPGAAGIDTMIMDSSQNIFISGVLYGSVNFDGLIASPTTIYFSPFIAKLNPSGVAQWIKKNDYINGHTLYLDHHIKFNSNGDLYYSGIFNSSSISFDSFSLSNSSSSTVDVFLAKVSNESLENYSFNYQNLSIYPNPTNDFLYFNNLNLLENKNIDIYDNLGRLVERKFSILNDRIDVSSLNKGVYVLKIEQKCIKFIKE